MSSSARVEPPQPRPAAELPASEPTLSWMALGVYAIPAGTVGMMYTIIVISYAKYATDVLLVSGTLIGSILLASRVWDAVSDPIVGYLSDRTKLRFGRRKSWIVASAVPLGLFSTAMWAPLPGLGDAATAAWLTVSIFGFYTAYTAFEVPHTSLGAELSFRSADRNRLYGARQLAKTALGVLGAALIGASILEARGYEQSVALNANFAMSAVVAVTVLLAAWRLPAEPAEHAGRGAANPFKAVRDVWSNRYARIILVTYLVESFGMGGIGVLTPYVVEYVMLRPDLIQEMLGVYILSGVLGIPLWIRLANHFEKRKLWLFAMGQACVGFGMLIFLSENSWPLMLVSSVIAGSANACGSVLGTAIKAEVIDYDELMTGERKEGAYFAGWAFMHKLAGGLMLGMVLFTLDAVGYVANAAQTDAVKFWMLALMGGAPIVGYLIGMAVFYRFDLSEADHRGILDELARRSQAAPH